MVETLKVGTLVEGNQVTAGTTFISQLFGIHTKGLIWLTVCGISVRGQLAPEGYY